MIMDYHIHTVASLDAKGSMVEYVKKAKQGKLDEIGFSEHTIFHDIEGRPFIPINSNYLQIFLDLKTNAELPVKLGAEVDFISPFAEKIKDFIQKIPFDYVIGAVHFIGNWSVDSPKQIHEYSKRDILKVYEEYFSLVKKLCACRLFDILAHPDLIKIFGFKPKTDFSHLLEGVAEAMAKYNVCAEINTSGLRRLCHEIYPSEQFLKILHSYSVPIVFGSDAHEPNEVGKDFEKAIKLAKKVGYTQVCVFNQRRRDFVNI
ncbi:MAG: histidinol-phosphatase HisJ family protein [Candidatus Bathycorpusculaceae bacterium]